MNGHTASVWKNWEIPSSALGQPMMTLCECRIDRPFPDHVIRCWVRTRPPPTVCTWGLFKTLFLSLPLRCRNAVTGLLISMPGSHSSTSSSTSPLPSVTTPQSVVLAFFLFICGAFLWRAAFCPFLAKSCFSARLFLIKYVVRVALLLGPLAPPPPPSGCLDYCLTWVVVRQSIGPEPS